MKRAARCAFQSISIRRLSCADLLRRALEAEADEHEAEPQRHPGGNRIVRQEQQFRGAAQAAERGQRREGQKGEGNGEDAAGEGDLGQQPVVRREPRTKHRRGAPERAGAEGIEGGALRRDVRLHPRRRVPAQPEPAAEIEREQAAPSGPAPQPRPRRTGRCRSAARRRRRNGCRAEKAGTGSSARIRSRAARSSCSSSTRRKSRTSKRASEMRSSASASAGPPLFLNPAIGVAIAQRS